MRKTVPMQTDGKRHTWWHYLLMIGYYTGKSLLGEIPWILIGIGGYVIFQTRKTPYDLVFGLPLLLISIGLLVNFVWSNLLAIFSPQFNKAKCILCGNNDWDEDEDAGSMPKVSPR